MCIVGLRKGIGLRALFSPLFHHKQTNESRALITCYIGLGLGNDVFVQKYKPESTIFSIYCAPPSLN